MYIENKETYPSKIAISKKKLKKSANKINRLFDNSDVTQLPNILEEYDNNVEKHYQEFIDTNKVWNKLKKMVQEENK